jgi:hypothetical protein
MSSISDYNSSGIVVIFVVALDGAQERAKAVVKNDVTVLNGGTIIRSLSNKTIA